MPAAEFIEWQSYFQIYPFSFQAAEIQFARLLYFIYNTAGKIFKPVSSHEIFLPDYMIEQKEVIYTQKTIEQQQREMSHFVSKLKKFEETKTL